MTLAENILGLNYQLNDEMEIFLEMCRFHYHDHYEVNLVVSPDALSKFCIQ